MIDSGATVHVTSRSECFTSYTQGEFGVVRMGNNDLSKVVGKGDVNLTTMDGSTLILKDVRHVPDMRLNLISVERLDEEGFCTTFRNGMCKISRGSLVVAKGLKMSKLYVVRENHSEGVNYAGEENSTELWHRRLGHISEKNLTRLVSKKVLPDIKQVHMKQCTNCLAGKQNRISFKSSPPSRVDKILDLVHSDLCGPMPLSLGGARYWVTFIDDHSRKIWVWTLKTKDQVTETFKNFLNLVERQTGIKLKCIRTDNGGEYIGSFDEICKRNGIRHQLTPPKTPQLNGLAERMNRTLAERVRSMLSHAKLTKDFWGEAVVAAAYILNRSPCVPLNYDVPEQVWQGKEISYNHLRVFGCVAYVHIPKDERQKLDDKTRKCIFIDYGEDQFGYKFYSTDLKKPIRSRDAIFQENEFLETAGKENSGSEQDLEWWPSTVNPQPVEDEEIQNDHDDDEIRVHSEPPAESSSGATTTRSGRAVRPSTRYSPNEYILLTDGGEPESFEEAILGEHKDKWMEAMQDEMQSLHDNDTFELVKLPKGKKALKNKWVFRLKHEEHSSQPRFKARIVVKGFGQKHGIDFDEIFSPW